MLGRMRDSRRRFRAWTERRPIVASALIAIVVSVYWGIVFPWGAHAGLAPWVFTGLVMILLFAVLLYLFFRRRSRSG
jgi:uncharacterized membrane protein SirB2